MGVKLVSSGGGSVEINPPATASNFVATMPAATGTVVVGASAVSAAGQIPFSTNGTSYTPTAKIVSATAVASTSGTSIDFTGIPSWVKRITVLFSGVSTSGTSLVQVQIGSGSFNTSGYTSQASFSNASTCFITATTGFAIEPSACGSATNARHGSLTLSLLTGTTWVGNGAVGSTLQQCTVACSGTSPALSGTLDRLRITTVGGTDTFDAGSINILYE